MGLGKTLQVLTYLAWAIEQGKITAPGGDLDIGPYRPILIIAPLILLARFSAFLGVFVSWR